MNIRLIAWIVLVLIMSMVTIHQAMAVQEDKLILAPGDTHAGFFILPEDSGITDVSFPQYVTGNITPRDDGSIIRYTITLPENMLIDSYSLPFDSDNETVALIDLSVQKPLVVGFYELFTGNRTFIVTIGVVIGILLLSLLGFQLAHYLKRRPAFLGFLIFTVLLGGVMGLMVVVTQTDILVKHPGSSFNHTLVLEGPGDGTVRITRNDDTPKAADYVQVFGSSETYYHLPEGAKKTLYFTIILPETIERGRYHYDILTITKEGRSTITKSFWVI